MVQEDTENKRNYWNSCKLMELILNLSLLFIYGFLSVSQPSVLGNLLHAEARSSSGKIRTVLAPVDKKMQAPNLIWGLMV